METRSSADRLGPPDVAPSHHGGVVHSRDEAGQAFSMDVEARAATPASRP